MAWKNRWLGRHGSDRRDAGYRWAVGEQDRDEVDSPATSGGGLRSSRLFGFGSRGSGRMDFTAIDFETANYRRDSACQLGIVVVRNRCLVERRVWLIRPRPLHFEPGNIAIHGIQPSDVEGHPDFGGLWPEIQPYLESTCLVAHNASFDLGVMKACAQANAIRLPLLSYTCTRAIARAAWPGRRGYGLRPLADWLGIRFNHHDALEDAVACARVLLAASNSCGADDLDSLERTLQLRRGSADPTRCIGPRRAGAAGSRPARNPPVTGSLARDGNGPREPTIDWQRILIRADFVRPWAGKRVAVTGQLSGISAAQCERLVTRLGATLQRSVTDQTELLIIGTADQRTAQAQASRVQAVRSVEQQPAIDGNRAGGPIEIWDEQRFLAWLMSRLTADPAESVVTGSQRSQRWERSDAAG